MAIVENIHEKKDGKPLITIMVPCHNEEANVRDLYKALDEFSHSSYLVDVRYPEAERMIEMNGFDFEFLFVDDGSMDRTAVILDDLRKADNRVNILTLSRNFGKENAMLAGMDFSNGDAVVMMDADFQDPIDAIPEMIFWWIKGYDDVYGKRISRGQESWLRKKMSLAFYRMLKKMSNTDILPNVGDFRLLDRKAVDALRQLRETQRYTKGLYCWIGFRKKEVSFDRGDRMAGKSNYTFRKLLNLAVEGITSYTTAPLRISIVAGLLVSLLAFIYLVFMFMKTLIWGEEVSGFPTLICVILFLGGMQLLALGIIGEYVGRIFNETKGRPPYVVEQYNCRRAWSEDAE